MKTLKFIALACVTALTFTSMAALSGCANENQRAKNGTNMMNSAVTEENIAPSTPSVPDVPTPLPSPVPENSRPIMPRLPHKPYPRPRPRPTEKKQPSKEEKQNDKTLTQKNS